MVKPFRRVLTGHLANGQAVVIMDSGAANDAESATYDSSKAFAAVGSAYLLVEEARHLSSCIRTRDAGR